ncbi:SCO family protein [Vicingaceae bacterium]|nr:SCO family protein [Vicingaceae bacterium]
MRQVLPYVLWSAVAIVIGLMIARSNGWIVFPQKQTLEPIQYQKAFDQLLWDHLPVVSQFELTERNGREVTNDEFYGRPYVVSFFYADCPTICRDLNDRVKLLQQQFRNEDLVFLSVTCDPEVDTPKRLTDYADSYNADEKKWLFLTGALDEIMRFGRQSFKAIVETPNHTEDIFLVDRWGRYRDRFRWDDPEEMKRFGEIAQQVLDENVPPVGKFIDTRNILAGKAPTEALMPPWIDEFHLTTQDGEPFFSRELTGKVWIGSIFFSTCTTHCVQQNEYIRELQDRLPDKVVIVSITTDSDTDTPQVLAQYARTIKAKPNRWIFLTSKNNTYIRRTVGEFFGQFSSGQDHGTLLAIVDRWGVVRGRFDWRKPEQENEMFQLIERLQKEDRPARSSNEQ